MNQRIIIVGGPTASGKSALAMGIAEKLGGVIINADSQQLYRELRILTARPSAADEARVPHRLYGTLGGDQPCSAGHWLRLAKMEIDWALAQGAVPVVTGGTGLYLKALTQGMAEMPDIPPEVKQQSEADFNSMGKEAFAERLRAVDPQFFERLKVHDPQRLCRAYAVWLGSGKPLSWWQAQGSVRPYPQAEFDFHQPETTRETLYARCDARVTQMVEQGALEEVRGLPERALALEKIIGVREFRAHVRGETTLEAAITATQAATRHYAKRQMTWFRNQVC